MACVCRSLAACQRHTPSSLAAVIGLSNNDVISLRSLRCVRCVGWTLEMCTGMGFPVGMGIPGIPWDSHGNGNEKQIPMGMGMISVGVGMLENAL